MQVWPAPNLRFGDRVLLDAVGPGPGHGALGLFAADALPDEAVGLEAAADAELPHRVAAPDPPLGLEVRELVPERRGRLVAEPVERHQRRLHLALPEPEALPEAPDHRPPRRRQAEVVRGRAEVGQRHGRVPAGAELVTALARREEQRGDDIPQLLAPGEDGEAERDEVRAQQLADHAAHALAQREPRDALVVLLAVPRPVAPVVGALVRVREV
jgi:hypothetical protein